MRFGLGILITKKLFEDVPLRSLIRRNQSITGIRCCSFFIIIIGRSAATPPPAFPYGMAGWSVLCSFHSAGSPLGPSQLLRLPLRFHRPSFLSKHAQRLREDGTAQEERRQADKYIRTRVVTSTSMFIDVKQKLFLGTVASSLHPSI